MKRSSTAFVLPALLLFIFSAIVLLGSVSPRLDTPTKPATSVPARSSAGRIRSMSRNRTDQIESKKGLSNSGEAMDQVTKMFLPGWKDDNDRSNSGNAISNLRSDLRSQGQADLSKPQVVPMVGPVSQDRDLRTLPDIPQVENEAEQRLMRHPPNATAEEQSDPIPPVRVSSQAIAMPTPLNTFPGITSVESGCGCLPPDTDGDVGPNHYMQAVNSRIKIIDKSGTQLLAPMTYNSFFSALGTSTPCGNNQNEGDGIVFYDHMANRWVVSDFAFPAFPGTSFYQCIGVSKTADPVAGGWWLYALQTDPANTNYLGDYPKFGLWPDAYYLSVNLFSNNTTFIGVRVYALPRTAMINGTGAPNPGAVAFTITAANLGDAYSLVPASFRSGSPPPAGQPEYFMAVNSPATGGTVENQVFTWRFHTDFSTPANSIFGVGANHTPDGTITVNGFVDAFTTTTLIVPQNGTPKTLDTLGDKIMYPLAYQNRGGTESIYAAHTVNNNQNGTGPTAIRWYQFNVTGNTIPATPAQQQTFNNAADGLWRFMPSIAVDGQGDMVIGYSESSSSTEPAIAYAGRLVGDPANTLAQGEAILQAGGGHQTSNSGRWGDYSATFVDPSDNCTFWHTNEYYSATSSAGWNTRIGTFKFPGCSAPTAAAGSVSGMITDANGAPLAGATVNLSGARSVTTFTRADGSYHFDNLETGQFYTLTPSLANYSFSPVNRSFSLVGDTTDAAFTGTADATQTANAVDTTEYFVRQHYLDFLGREPDQGGFEYWTGQINQCNGDANCVRNKRIDVSASFFASPEFQQTGSYIYELYAGALGRTPNYNEFMPDRSQVVGGPNLETARVAFADAFVQRPEFITKYPLTLTRDQFVDALLQTMTTRSGADVSSLRDTMLSDYDTGGRSLAVRDAVQANAFAQAEYNKAFVLFEYFGYLRRNPDTGGYDFWLNVLNGREAGNYRGMVCAFLTSSEYQLRFSSVVTHSNSECGR